MAVAIVAIYVGAGIFVPLVLAVLLAFALHPWSMLYGECTSRLAHERHPAW